MKDHRTNMPMISIVTLTTRQVQKATKAIKTKTGNYIYT